MRPCRGGLAGEWETSGMQPVVLSVSSKADLRATLSHGGIAIGSPVLVCVGGADGMERAAADRLDELLDDHVVPALDVWGVTVVDGGTDSGVMRSLGLARARADARIPLVGIAASGTISAGDGGTGESEATRLERHHTHAVLVPGSQWGDESEWISAAAAVIAGDAPSATLLVNGGAIALDDAERSLADRRPLVVLSGSGRAADDISAATASSGRMREIRDHELTSVVPMADFDAVVRTLARLLGR